MTKDEALKLCNYLECNDASMEAQCEAAAFIREALAQPPQRTWVGLTDDEVYRIAFELEGEHWRKTADAIEAKLREKNQ